MNEYTADAWHDVLSREPWITLNMARDAVIEIKLRQPFVDVSEIIAQAKRAMMPMLIQRETEAILGPVRAVRDPLADPRPLRSTIREIVAKEWKDRPELDEAAGSE